MTQRPVFVHLLLGLLTIAIVIGGFASFQRKRSSFERIDFTFHRKQGVIVVDHVDPGSGAEQTGLRPGDEIWLIAGTPTTEVEGLQKTLRRIGQPVPLLVARGTTTLSVIYTPPELKIDYQYLFLSFIGFLYLAIGLFTLFRGSPRESLLFFFVTVLSFIVYVYTPAGDIDLSYRTLQLTEDFARILLPPLTLHFFLLFPRSLVRKRWLLGMLYLPPLIVALWDVDLFVFNNAVAVASPLRSAQILERWEVAHFAIYFSLAVVALAYTYRTAAAVGQKKQIKWIYLGMSLGFIPFLALYLIPFLFFHTSSALTTISILPLAFIPLAFAVSILKYKLWDVEVVIKEVLAYTVTFVFGMIAFSTINLLLSRVIEERLALERNFLTFASGLLIAGVLIPVKGKIESVIEMFLYRDTYRHRRAMSEWARELATFHDLHDLIEMLGQRLTAALRIQKMNLFLREGSTLAAYDHAPGVPSRVRISDFATIGREGPLMLDEPRLPDASDVPLALLKAGYRYAFPLRNRGELQGILLFGTKRGDEPLSHDDIHLIESLCAPVALAVENARLYTRLRRQLDEIRSLKEYNENIIESSSSAIAVVTADGLLLTANKAFWELVGGPGEEIDDSIASFFPPYDELMQSPTRSIQTHFVNRDGVEKEVTVTSSPLNANDVADGTHVLVAADIADRLRLERELQDKERLASLGLLAAGMAHEVNTPLTGISSYAQLLLADTPPTDPRYPLLKKMEQQTFRASSLVNNLLELAANRPRSASKVSTAQLVRDTLALHDELFRARDIHVHVGPLTDLPVRGNFSDLQQVLTNILLNARDAVKPGGNIWVDLRSDSGRTVIRVRDDGSGIAPELLGRIFEPLVTTKRGQGGTGLGLALAQRLLRASDGQITVESQPGQGATFSVSLPQLSLASSEN
jgi:two-component system NtrC family sensor kinase